ncbi:MAG: hypothetical protein WCB51_01290 [Candidatus Dormiibacterota bacterium]
MISTRRLCVLLTLPAIGVVVAACGGSGTSGNVTPVVSATNTPAATATPTGTPPPATQPPRTAPPRPTTSVNRADPGPFGGSWTGHGVTLNVSGDESANATYFVGVLCSSASPAPMPCDDDSVSPTIPGGQLQLHINEVDTTGGVAIALAEIRDSSDPKYTQGSIMKFTLKNARITCPIGTLTKVPSAA